MTKTRIIIAILLLLSGNHAKARFNTVFYSGNLYKITVENPLKTTNERKVTPESITSKNEEVLAPGKVSLSRVYTKKNKQATRYPGICYPLSRVKVNSPKGLLVKAGKVIDVTGNTGRGTGEHLSKLLTSVLIHGSVL